MKTMISIVPPGLNMGFVKTIQELLLSFVRKVVTHAQLANRVSYFQCFSCLTRCKSDIIIKDGTAFQAGT